MHGKYDFFFMYAVLFVVYNDTFTSIVQMFTRKFNLHKLCTFSCVLGLLLFFFFSLFVVLTLFIIFSLPGLI